jgi:membrane protease YdiL (CAAX protease family)
MNAFPENPVPEDSGQQTNVGQQDVGQRADVSAASTSTVEDAGSHFAELGLGSPETNLAADATIAAQPEFPLPIILPVPAPRDPAWSGLDVLFLVFGTFIALILGYLAVLAVAHAWLRPHTPITELARNPLLVVAGQAAAYVLILGYMYVLVTRARGCPSFLAAIHWNWPQNAGAYLFGGVLLSLALQALAHVLPMPKHLPIDTFFSTPAEAWALTIFGVTLAPLLEELFFRGFLYPVLRRSFGVTAAIFATAFAFALLHGSQLKFSWGPVLVIFLVGTVLTMVRAYKNSVAAGLIMHIAYNGTISVLMFVGTDGFRHLEKLNG